MNAEQQHQGAPLLELVDAHIGHTVATPLFEHLHLRITVGECVLMMGLNGTGKTTLMHTVLNQQPLLGGQIWLSGEAHTHARSRQHLAYLPENFIPPLEWSADNFLRSALTLYGTDYPKERIEHTLYHLLGHPFRTRCTPLAQASKGMRQHVALLSLFLSGRKLWILDEPLNGLDWRARCWAYEQMQEHLNNGGAIWLTSHDLTGLTTLTPRWGLLHDSTWTEFGVLTDTDIAITQLNAAIRPTIQRSLSPSSTL